MGAFRVAVITEGNGEARSNPLRGPGSIIVEDEWGPAHELLLDCSYCVCNSFEGRFSSWSRIEPPGGMWLAAHSSSSDPSFGSC